jgi:hypothetical protein
MHFISKSCQKPQLLEMKYLTVRGLFAAQGVVSSHELRKSFPNFDKRRLVE